MCNKMEKKDMRKNVLIVVLSVCVLVLAAAVVLLWNGNRSSGTEAAEAATQMEFDTAYCSLQFPAQWKDLVTVQETRSGNVVSEAFSCHMDGKEIPLFTIHFGNAGEGDLVGFLTAKGEKTAVYVQCMPFSGDESLSENQEFMIYAMMEGVNDVLASIENHKGYSAE